MTQHSMSDPALLSENDLTQWCRGARTHAHAHHIDPNMFPEDARRLYYKSARWKSERHHDDDLQRQEGFLYPRRQALPSPELASADRLWFRGDLGSGSPTTYNPLKDWKEQQRLKSVAQEETVLLTPPPASVMKAVNERRWQLESWEESERDPDKTEKRQTIKPSGGAPMET